MGVMAVAGILIEAASLRAAILLAIAIWAFCRLYYFMFYAIEKYIDPRFKFAGVWGAVAYVVRRRDR